LIVDQNYRDKYMLGSVAPGQPLPDGMAVAGGTLREIAETVGIDAAGLEETVARFNGFCASGVDEDFGRGSMGYGSQMFGDRRMPNPNLGPIDKPPYVAIKLTRIAMNTPAAGLRIDGDGAVQSVRGDTIPGLYAAGNAAAQLDIGAAYNSGMGNMRALLYGYIAAKAIGSR
jgi:3-oxosteroid 1-dehydrogenase